MTQEDKNLLLKDLCARLSYEVKGIRIYRPEETVTLAEIIPRCKINPNVGDGSFCELGFDETFDCCVITEFKPYLLPKSSMTKEERNEYHSYCDYYYGNYFDTVDSIDWLNKKMFDYRTDEEGKTMIEKGLALQAPEGMYN